MRIFDAMQIGGAFAAMIKICDGVHFKAGDAADLASTILGLLNAPERRQMMIDAGHRTATRFPAENHAALIVGIYALLMNPPA